MSSEGLHLPYEKLSRHTLQLHYAMTSVMEELQAVDWYRQRADDCDDPALKAILLHNAREEIEHASMVLEWIRRNDGEFDEQLRDYLFKDGSITGREHAARRRDLARRRAIGAARLRCEQQVRGVRIDRARTADGEVAGQGAHDPFRRQREAARRRPV